MAELNAGIPPLHPGSVADAAVGADRDRIDSGTGFHMALNTRVAYAEGVREDAVGPNVPRGFSFAKVTPGVQAANGVVGVGRVEAVGGDVVAFQIDVSDGRNGDGKNRERTPRRPI